MSLLIKKTGLYDGKIEDNLKCGNGNCFLNIFLFRSIKLMLLLKAHLFGQMAINIPVNLY